MIKIIAIGKKHESWIVDGIERYSKRLQGSWKLEWVLLPHSALEGPAARQEESQRILQKLDERDRVVLLDETGSLWDSPALSRQIQDQLDVSTQLVLVIGGAYGVNEALQRRANQTWSLSRLVFPHQLVRLLVVEQLYRASCIASGHPYHHQ
ncbi:MAG TPA: 23S rRNA (pseudouridine(1915)-N(3))-methyltransferase RlmH [Candidatus Saccharimonas sp.]|jgi:23S rRNA (pseudouridine1915-N3)-methyltransferase|nr:23S rRNA (pseudouridine(1915)-N(3))-methyltransferase RlmH [Candidatus Saccharimonas sp.]